MSYTTPVAPSSHFDPAVLRATISRERGGFIQRDELAQLAAHKDSRLWLVLVRCGSCRFLAAAQDAKHLMDIIAFDGRDYVRDVSFPALGEGVDR
jgi:hypothetical protein